MARSLFLRASALPLAFRCPGSVHPGIVSLNETHESAFAGTAAHEALRSLAETGSINWDSLTRIAERYQVDPDELRMLSALGAKLWNTVSQSFPDALTEVGGLAVEVAPGVILSGHLDVLSISGTVARAGDWKTGRKDGDYSQQMRAYGALVLLDNPELTEVTVTVLWVRDCEAENYTMTRADTEKWLQELIQVVVEWDGVYRPGRLHCKHCPRSHECEAANALVRRDVAAIADKQLVARAECEIEMMSPSEIVEVLQKADLVSSYAERVRQAIKRHIEDHGDVVADGVRLTIQTDTKRELDPIRAWPVLESKGFKDEDFAECIDLRISRVEKRIAKNAGRGKGAGSVRELGDALAKAQAIETKEVRKLVTKRA